MGTQRVPDVRQVGGDDRPAPGAGLEVALGGELVVGGHDGHRRDAEVLRVGADPGQHRAGPDPPVEDRPAERDLDLSVEGPVRGPVEDDRRVGHAAQLPVHAFPMHTGAGSPGFVLGPLRAATHAPVPIGTQPAMGTLRAPRHLRVPCLRDRGTGRSRQGPSRGIGAAVRRRVRREGGVQGGDNDADPARRPGLAARGRDGGDHDRRRCLRLQLHVQREPDRGPGLDAGRDACGLVRRPGRVAVARRADRPLQHRLRPGAGNGRRHGDPGRLAGGHAVQPLLPHAGHRGERGLGRVVDARGVHRRLQVRARPRDPGPDAGQRRREGPGRQRRRDDRDLDPARRAQVVRRPGPHVRRLQVRLGVGAQPRQRGRRHLGLRRRHGVGLPVRDRDGPALQERVRGLHHDGRSPRCRATTCPRSRSRTRSTARASGPTRSRSCRRAARSSSSPSRPPRRFASRATRTTRAGRRASRPTSTPWCSSGTAIPTR